MVWATIIQVMSEVGLNITQERHHGSGATEKRKCFVRKGSKFLNGPLEEW